MSVALAVRHPALQSGLSDLIASDHGLDLVGTAADVHAALVLVRDRRPAVLVLDLALPGADLELIVAITAACAATRVLCLSGNTVAAFEPGITAATHLFSSTTSTDILAVLHELTSTPTD